MRPFAALLGAAAAMGGAAWEPSHGDPSLYRGKHAWASPYAGDTTSNLAAQARMLSLAASPRLIVPGHDPAVFERFPTPGNGMAKIAPRRAA